MLRQRFKSNKVVYETSTKRFFLFCLLSQVCIYIALMSSITLLLSFGYEMFSLTVFYWMFVITMACWISSVGFAMFAKEAWRKRRKAKQRVSSGCHAEDRFCQLMADDWIE